MNLFLKCVVLLLFFVSCIRCETNRAFAQKIVEDTRFIVYQSTGEDVIRLYWKNQDDEIYGNFDSLRKQLSMEGIELVFACNGGMYKKDRSPQGLYIEDQDLKMKLDTINEGYGNFYLQPNGVFYINEDGSAQVESSTNFRQTSQISYATQSGPMLVIENEINPKFRDGSSNLNIRNGVGILANGEVLLAISKEKINFYDFAQFFKLNGCQNALYLDGFVSRVYYPPHVDQKGGDFGVIIGLTKK